MAALSDTTPRAGDEPHVTSKKVLQRLNQGLTVAGGQGVRTSVDGNTLAANVRPVASWEMDMAAGRFNSHDGVGHFFGYNAAVPNGGWADVWSYGPTQAQYVWPTTVEPVRVKAGGDGADTAGGAGARQILVWGLDGDWNEVMETIDLKGAAASDPTSNSFYRVNAIYVTQTGAEFVANTGDIALENVTSNQILSHIAAGNGTSQAARWSVPAGYSLYTTNFTVQVATGVSKDVDCRVWGRNHAGFTRGSAPYPPKVLFNRFVAIQDIFHLPFSAWFRLKEKTDAWAEAYGNGAVSGVNVLTDFFIAKD
jgi:hypothetical protein